jgi:hypothetical protein
MESFRNQFMSPSDAIYVFDENIQYVITQQLTSMCDSIFGKGFVTRDQIKEIKSIFKEDLYKFQLPNPEIQIDSKNLEPNLVLNEHGFSSMKYKLDDLTSSSPLSLDLNNLLTEDCMSRILELSTNGYKITFNIDATCKEVKKDGIYTVSDKSVKSVKMDSPYHKYIGDCMIGISILVKNHEGKNEYYFKKIYRPCSHYTQIQYADNEVTYL